MKLFDHFKKKRILKEFLEISEGIPALKYLVEKFPVDSVHYYDPQDKNFSQFYYARNEKGEDLFLLAVTPRKDDYMLTVDYEDRRVYQQVLCFPGKESIREWFKVPENKFVEDLMPYTEGDLKIYGILQSMDKNRDILVQEGESVYVIKRKYSSGYKIRAEFVINRWARSESHSCFSCYYQVRIRCGRNSRIFRDSSEFVTSNYCKHWLK